MTPNEKLDLEREVYERILGELETDKEVTDYDLTDHLEIFCDIDPEADRGYTIKVTVEIVDWS